MSMLQTQLRTRTIHTRQAHALNTCDTVRLEHDPEKWEPVFGKKSCSNKVAHSGRRDETTQIRDASGWRSPLAADGARAADASRPADHAGPSRPRRQAARRHGRGRALRR